LNEIYVNHSECLSLLNGIRVIIEWNVCHNRMEYVSSLNGIPVIIDLNLGHHILEPVLS